jgi:SAM-dependent methyltransferase
MTNDNENLSVKLQQTRQHYEDYPYEVDVRDSSVYLSDKNPIGRFILKIDGGIALDLGCGPGNLLPALSSKAGRTVGFDLSPTSLRHAATAVDKTRVSLVQGNALSLPFPNDGFDFVIAAGSIHHTPDAKAAFFEACRVLRPGGRAFVSVYGDSSYYSLMYKTLGALARACERVRLSAIVVNRCIILPVFLLYLIAGRLVVHRKLTVPSYNQLMNYFADQILNPVVSFHNADQIKEWAKSAGVVVNSTVASHGGALLNFEIHRPQSV